MPALDVIDRFVSANQLRLAAPAMSELLAQLFFSVPKNQFRCTALAKYAIRNNLVRPALALKRDCKIWIPPAIEDDLGKLRGTLGRIRTQIRAASRHLQPNEIQKRARETIFRRLDASNWRELVTPLSEGVRSALQLVVRDAASLQEHKVFLAGLAKCLASTSEYPMALSIVDLLSKDDEGRLRVYANVLEAEFSQGTKESYIGTFKPYPFLLKADQVDGEGVDPSRREGAPIIGSITRVVNHVKRMVSWC